MTESKLPAAVRHPRAVKEYYSRECSVEGGEGAVGDGRVSVNLPKKGESDDGINPLESCLVVCSTHQLTFWSIDCRLIEPGRRRGEEEVECYC